MDKQHRMITQKHYEYQTYLDEIKSDQRDKVALAGEKYKYIE